MQSRALQKILSAAANPTRAEHFFDQLKTTEAAPNLKTISEEQARILAALFSGSQALSEWLIAHPDGLAVGQGKRDAGKDNKDLKGSKDKASESLMPPPVEAVE